MTSIVCKSPKAPCQPAALGIYMLSALKSLEPGFDFDMPTVEFLKDTTKPGQWRRTKNYYGESLWGTDWPDRWLFSEVA